MRHTVEIVGCRKTNQLDALLKVVDMLNHMRTIETQETVWRMHGEFALRVQTTMPAVRVPLRVRTEGEDEQAALLENVDVVQP
jgi:hypothetical protein